ncbi:STAS domain-containing protein [Tahibacter amnicola]|uniref:STAS domain-containing protein n=1 Tax=Tahibacter amnicola TaxID=2976241 RepID=A0ABY6BDK7_9GAMM|nr:STAS domain-containing protein [Tahibacter amnicola]UXI67892.1 STAS domain-containing protein [Tahibacter amnicola]
MSAPVTCQVGVRDGVLAVTGALVFATAARALAEARAPLARGEARSLDLAKVTVADSAGLGVVLSLVRQARRQGTELPIRHAPASLLALAQLCEVDALLGLQAGEDASPV